MKVRFVFRQRLRVQPEPILLCLAACLLGLRPERVRAATVTNIGGGTIAGTVTDVPGGANITAAGTGAGGSSDQFTFRYEVHAGDFDVKVRVASIAPANAWSRAGLMARGGGAANAPFAAVWATPNIAGCFFQFRATAGAAAVSTGRFPANHPYTWLRLRRLGNTFNSYGSFDGANWALIGSATVILSDPIWLGLGAASLDAAQTSTAQLRDHADAIGTGLGRFEPNREAIGPSSRRTGLVFSEIMYHPRPAPGPDNSLEFIELFNTQSIAEDLSGYRISGDVDFTFPPGTVLPPGGLLVVARNPAALQAQYGLSGVLGPYTNNLPNDGGTVRLRNELDAVCLEVNYGTRDPWPRAADGAGHSLALARPSYGESHPMAWTASDVIGGSPGRLEGWGPEPLRAVVINELLARTADPQPDFIELYNHGNEPADVSGCLLSDDLDALSAGATTNVFRIPAGTIIPPRGFVAFDEHTLGFALRAAGETVYLVNSNQTRVLDAVAFEGQALGVSIGRSPDGTADWSPLEAPTPGTANAAPRRGEIVINEIMHTPISGNPADEFVELFNRGTNTVDLGGWVFTDGIRFTFPSNTTLPPGGYLVVAADAARLMARHPGVLTSANTVGNFTGNLSGRGERLALARPESVVETNAFGGLETNTLWIVVNEVTYGVGGGWGYWADGGGSSLELVDPHSDNRRADNWADSDESAKSAWTVVQYSGANAEVLGSPPNVELTNDNLHIYLLGAGECLVDDVEVSDTGSPNLIVDPGFEAGGTNWFFQGAFDQSSFEPGGYGGGWCLHLRGSTRGDPGANKVRSSRFQNGATPVTLSSSGLITLRCRARWLRGWPELLLRVHGGGVEAFGRLPVPENLGTPGAPNSRRVANAGPALWNVRHAPVLPAPNESVVVTARAADPDGLASLTLLYRIDPSLSYASRPMRDDGTGGDAVAGDGIFSAVIDGQPSNTVVVFHLLAVDAAGASNTFPRMIFPASGLARIFPSDAPLREALVRFGAEQPWGAFGTYHLWLSQTNRDRWANRDHLNNADVDATFVYNNERAVYNVGAQYSGSPFHRGQMDTGPDGSDRVDYILHMPEDDRVLGETDFNIALPGNGSGGDSRDPSGVAEQIAFIVFRKVGVPFEHRRFIHVFVHGTRRSQISSLTGPFALEDAQQPNGEFIRQWYPDDPDGQLIKIEDWFEFNDSATSFRNNDGDFQRRHVPGTTNVNLARYRYMWRPRAVGPGESANNYTNWLRLLDAISPTTNDTAPFNLTAVQAVADFDQWLREIAAQKTVGNFDAYGYDRGKNNYLYFPRSGRAELIPWDVDWVLGQGSRATNDSVLGSSDPRMVQAYVVPAARRAYLRAFQTILDRVFSNARLDPLIDERVAAFSRNGTVYNPTTVANIKAWIAGRRAFLLSQIPPANFALTTNWLTVSSNLVTLSGSAPVTVAEIRINGVPAVPTWTTVTNWTLQTTVASGTNHLVVQGFDAEGGALAGASNGVTVILPGPTDPPEGFVVINEIMHTPQVPNAGYVELHNRSTNTTFDLSGWRLNGLDYVFPAGTFLRPRGFVVVAQDTAAFQTAYGAGVTPVGEFQGVLQPDGETLSLLRPGPTPGAEQVVDQVRYEAVPPWPTAASGTGTSLQLIDPAQDNGRAGAWFGEWRAGYTNYDWVFVSVTGSMGPINRLLLYLNNVGEVDLDDISLVRGPLPAVGTNYVRNGDFETPLYETPALTNSWVVNTNYTNSFISSSVKHSGAGGLHMVCTRFGNATNLVIFQNLSPAPPNGAQCTLSFWYLPSLTATSLTVKIQGSATLTTTVAAQPNYVPPLRYRSPGAGNITTVSNLLPFPPLWLNEVQPENLNGPADALGHRAPWIELYNAGTNALPLDGFYLANNYTNLEQWAFPAGSVIEPGEFKVIFADGAEHETTATEWHTRFTLAPGTGSVALSCVHNGRPLVLDYLNYRSLLPDRSYGALPDGQPFTRQSFHYVTPGGPNNGTPAPLVVFINEWMADNTLTRADPADGDFEDWFEIYNPGTNTVDLEGFYLTDSLTNQFQYRIPAGYQIPPRGFLLVWADGEPGQNQTNRADLHTSFRLERNGEAVGLFASDGTLVDAVSFGAQVRDLSQGRYPNGAPSLFFMTTPTPGTNNFVPGVNTAPQLAPLGDQHVTLGQTLSVRATATDPEAPPQTLTFSLDPGAPAGATINPLTGLFVWTPTPLDSATNVVTIRVVDDGSPALGDAETITITVWPPPRLHSVAPAGGQFELRFPTVPGKTYRILYKDNLDDPSWRPLGPDFLGDGSERLVPDDPTSHPQRFYRIMQVD